MVIDSPTGVIRYEKQCDSCISSLSNVHWLPAQFSTRIYFTHVVDSGASKPSQTLNRTEGLSAHVASVDSSQ